RQRRAQAGSTDRGASGLPGRGRRPLGNAQGGAAHEPGRGRDHAQAPPRAVRAGFPPGHRPAHVAVAQDHDQLRVPAPGGQDHPDAAPGRRVTDAPGRSPSSVDDVLSEYGGLEAQLSDPALHEDPAAARRVGKRFAELTPVVQPHQALAPARDDLAAARELADDDASFADEPERLAAEAETLEAKHADLLGPRDPHDAADELMDTESASARDDLAAARALGDDEASFADEAERLAAEAEPLEAKLADLLAPRDPLDADDVLMEIKSGEGGEESALFASELARMYTRYAEKHGWVVQMLGATESDLGGVKDASLCIRARQTYKDGVRLRLELEGGVNRV